MKNQKPRKKNTASAVLVAAAAVCIVLAGLVFFSMQNPTKKPGKLRGYVVDASTGSAIAGVDVSSTDSTGKKYEDLDHTDATRQDGLFTLELPAGEYTVQCSAAGYEDYSSDISFSVTAEKITELTETIALTPLQPAVDEAAEEAARKKAEEEEAARKAAEEEAEAARKAAEEEAARKKAEEEAEAARKAAEEEAARKKAEEEEAARKAAEEKAAQEAAEQERSRFTVNSSQTEDYGYNLKPEDYYSYYSDTSEFFFSYPPNLYNSVYSDFSSRDTLLGTNVETHTFSGSKGSTLTFSLTKRTDNLNLSSAKDKMYSQEAAEIATGKVDLLDEVSKEGFSRFVVTGYNSSGDIIYKLVKINPSYVMEMRIQCPPYSGKEDKLQKRYVQECIYRWCGFASSKPGAPRPYSEFIKDKDNQ